MIRRPPPPRPRPPRRTVAGRYALRRPVGRGATATVWAAWDRRDRRAVAVKVLPVGDADALVRSLREQALRVGHPHLLAPLGWAAEDDEVVIVVPLMTGGSLREAAAAGPLDPATVLDVLDQVLSGLEELHRRGWVHRDVTPANVLLERPGRPWRVRVADLGVAARIGAAVAPGTAPGTDGYLAPEALAGAPVDPRLDLYAVGVLGRRLLTAPPGAPPTTASSEGPEARPAVLSEVLAEVLAVLDRLADPEPSRRPASAAHARALLRAVAARTGAAPRPHATMPPSPVLVTAASGCFAAATVLGAVALMSALR